MIQVLYFASLREQLGLSGEEVEVGRLPSLSVAGLLDCLRAQGDPWQEVLASERSVLMAVNQEIARPQSAVADGDEVAFFPPVTGG